MSDNSHEIFTRHSRLEHEVIARLVEPGAKVLDLGCGEGDLLQLLKDRNQVTGTGVEVSEEKVYLCVRKGLTVFHGDVDQGLADFPDQSFDYVLLTETLQEIHKPELVLREVLRVGKRGIISFPNFAHWRNRLQLCLFGLTPVTPTLPHSWYDTPNIQYVTIKDFLRFCQEKNYRIVDAVYLRDEREIRFWPNLFADTGIIVLEME